MLHFDDLPPATMPHQDSVPIWLGGATPAALARTGRHYDGWLPYPPDPADYESGWAAVRRAAGDAGRDPTTITPALFATVLITEDVVAGRQALGDYSQANYGMPLEALRTIQVVVAGSASEVRERLRPYLAGGARHLVCRIAALDLRTQYEQLELIRSIA